MPARHSTLSDLSGVIDAVAAGFLCGAEFCKEWSEKQARVGEAGLNPRPRTRRNGRHLTVHFIYTLYTILQKGSTFLTVLLRYIFWWIFLRFCRERIFYSTSASLHLCIYPHEIGVLLYLHRLMYARKSLLKILRSSQMSLCAQLSPPPSRKERMQSI